jgi:transposase
MERRKFTREFKLEAVRLIKERGVSYAQASLDLGVHQSHLRGWVKAPADDPQHAFPGQGQMKPEQLEIAQLKREVIRLKAERDILKNHRGSGPPVGRETATRYRSLWEGAAVGFLVADDPVKKHGPWAVASLRVATSSGDPG